MTQRATAAASRAYECVGCGQPFLRRTSLQKFCSLPCFRRQPVRQTTRKGRLVGCQQCGKQTYRYPSTVGKRFCSLSCRDAATRAKRVNEKAGTAKCARCQQWKSIREFVRGGPKGRPHSYCKPCNRRWFESRRRRLGQKPVTPPDVAAANAKAYKYEYNRRATHMRRAAGEFPDKWTIGQMLCRQDGRCGYCRVLLERTYHIDHKTPVTRGGTNKLSNLHLTCARCNLIKGTMTHEEFLVSKKRRPAQWAPA